MTADVAVAGPPVVAIFVGGASSRMGGHPKGLLVTPVTGEPIVGRLVRAARALGAEPVLVGEASAYRALDLDARALHDDPPGIGPLGGLSAALAYAGTRPVLAVACDMPHVSEHTLATLRDHPSHHPIVAARAAPDAPWEPLLARYDAPRVRPVLAAFLARGGRSFQRLFAELDVEALPSSALSKEALVDWDSPEDIA